MWQGAKESEGLNFQLEVDIENTTVRYLLEIQNKLQLERTTQIQLGNTELWIDEQLWVDDKLIMEFSDFANTQKSYQEGEGLYFSLLSKIPYWNYALVENFYNFISGVQFFDLREVRKSFFNRENNEIDLKDDGSNFVAWYANRYEERILQIRQVEQKLKKLFTDFSHFEFQKRDYFFIKTNRVFVGCYHENKEYFFHHLERGEQILIMLYAIIIASDENSFFYINEPENFIGEDDLMLWYETLLEYIEKDNKQCILCTNSSRLGKGAKVFEFEKTKDWITRLKQ